MRDLLGAHAQSRGARETATVRVNVMSRLVSVSAAQDFQAARA